MSKDTEDTAVSFEMSWTAGGVAKVLAHLYEAIEESLNAGASVTEVLKALERARDEL